MEALWNVSTLLPHYTVQRPRRQHPKIFLINSWQPIRAAELHGTCSAVGSHINFCCKTNLLATLARSVRFNYFTVRVRWIADCRDSLDARKGFVLMSFNFLFTYEDKKLVKATTWPAQSESVDVIWRGWSRRGRGKWEACGVLASRCYRRNKGGRLERQMYRRTDRKASRQIYEHIHRPINWQEK
jgi:hypothetical protein